MKRSVQSFNVSYGNLVKFANGDSILVFRIGGPTDEDSHNRWLWRRANTLTVVVAMAAAVAEQRKHLLAEQAHDRKRVCWTDEDERKEYEEQQAEELATGLEVVSAAQGIDWQQLRPPFRIVLLPPVKVKPAKGQRPAAKKTAKKPARRKASKPKRKYTRRATKMTPAAEAFREVAQSIPIPPLTGE